MKGKFWANAFMVMAIIFSAVALAGTQGNPEDDPFFKDIKDFQTVSVGPYTARIPILYYDVDSFMAIYSADAAKVTASLPGTRLKPIKLGPNRALLLLGYNETEASSIGSYREFYIGIPCICRHEGRNIFGVYVHKMPLTSDIARLGGIEYWGFPKFLVNIDSGWTDKDTALSIDESGQKILEMRISRKNAVPWSAPGSLGVFTIKEGNIIYTKGNGKGKSLIGIRGKSEIKTGPHPMGIELAEFKLGKSPVAVIWLEDMKSILSLGQNLGPLGDK